MRINIVPGLVIENQGPPPKNVDGQVVDKPLKKVG